MKVASLWSGGKDSCFACYKAMRMGYEVGLLINFISSRHGVSLAHGLNPHLIREQAELTEIPFFQKEMPEKRYREEFIKVINRKKLTDQIKGIVFGDIYLEEHKDWIEEVCMETEVEPVFPLWGKETGYLYDEFSNAGFRAVIVSVKSPLPGREYLGCILDDKIKEEFLKIKIDPCGEKGEYHSFVTCGPIMKKRIEILEYKIICNENLCQYDVLTWRIND